MLQDIQEDKKSEEDFMNTYCCYFEVCFSVIHSKHCALKNSFVQGFFVPCVLFDCFVTKNMFW